MDYFDEAGGPRTRLAVVAAAILIALAIGVAVWPGAIETLAGFRAAPAVTPPDDLPQLSSADATPFFQRRDQIEIRVAEATTLRRFLDRNRLNKPYQRKQILDQLGVQLGKNNPDAEIAAGTVFKLRLTPIAEDVPGTTPRQQPR